MSSKSKKLGTLADIYQAETLDGAIHRIRVDRLFPSPDQPRKNTQVGIDELAASIDRDGLLSPLVVTKEGDKYRIIAGERRYHAIRKLGWVDAECRILSRKERDLYRISIIENLQRENLSAHEEAMALARLKTQENYSDQELANVVGKSRNYVTEILGIAILPENVLDECRNLGIENKNLMIQVVQAYKKEKWEDFLSAFKEGRIRTVKNAKDFIQGKETEEESVQVTPSIKPARESFKEERIMPEISIHAEGSNVTIHCPNPGTAALLHRYLSKNISKILR